MKMKQLGKSGIQVSPLAFGGNVFGWTIDESTSFKLLDAFVAAGFNFIDTADIYSTWKPGNKGGESETILGNWMRARANRSKLVIATKVGMEMAPGRSGLSAKHIVKSVEDSLRRLQTDYIDLYQSHQDDPLAPLEETLTAFSKLIAAGKVRSIGASNYTADRLSEALETSQRLKIGAYQCLQPEYNLYNRKSFELQLEPLCLEQDIGVIPYYSLASGFLSGKYRSEKDLSQSTRGGKVSAYLNDRGFRILKALDEVARNQHCPLASVALAWLMHRPSITAPIASATNMAQLSELTRAADLKLSSDEVKALDASSAY